MLPAPVQTSKPLQRKLMTVQLLLQRCLEQQPLLLTVQYCKMRLHKLQFIVGWISGTLSQGYTDLQSLVKCLDDRGIVLVFCSSFM